jgi:hypothetical protein
MSETKELTVDELLETAWGVITNVSGGDWRNQGDDWVKTAEEWKRQWLRFYQQGQVAPPQIGSHPDLLNALACRRFTPEQAVDLIRRLFPRITLQDVHYSASNMTVLGKVAAAVWRDERPPDYPLTATLESTAVDPVALLKARQKVVDQAAAAVTEGHERHDPALLQTLTMIVRVVAGGAFDAGVEAALGREAGTPLSPALSPPPRKGEGEAGAGKGTNA